jgi:hypothetical protein
MSAESILLGWMMVYALVYNISRRYQISDSRGEVPDLHGCLERSGSISCCVLCFLFIWIVLQAFMWKFSTAAGTSDMGVGGGVRISIS